jgi:hypothetical protein
MLPYIPHHHRPLLQPPTTQYPEPRHHINHQQENDKFNNQETKMAAIKQIQEIPRQLIELIYLLTLQPYIK